MDQVEKLLELYKQTKTSSERQLLLETVRISGPDEFSRLQERILKEQVRGMTMEQLVQVIATHRCLSLEQAAELLRDTIFQNLLDRAKLAVEQIASSGTAKPPSPVTTKEPVVGETVVAAQVAPQAAELDKSDRGVEVVILQPPSQGEEIPTVVGKISEANQNSPSSAPLKSASATSLPRLAPRGIGG
jgi:hypothetical protein